MGMNNDRVVVIEQELDRLRMNLSNLRGREGDQTLGETPENPIDNERYALDGNPDCFPGLWHVRTGYAYATPCALREEGRKLLQKVCRGSSECRPSMTTRGAGRQLQIKVVALVRYRDNYLRRIEEEWTEQEIR